MKSGSSALLKVWCTHHKDHFLRKKRKELLTNDPLQNQWAILCRMVGLYWNYLKGLFFMLLWYPQVVRRSFAPPPDSFISIQSLLYSIEVRWNKTHTTPYPPLPNNPYVVYSFFKEFWDNINVSKRLQLLMEDKAQTLFTQIIVPNKRATLNVL